MSATLHVYRAGHHASDGASPAVSITRRTAEEAELAVERWLETAGKGRSWCAVDEADVRLRRRKEVKRGE